jgi:hypothetical protein
MTSQLNVDTIVDKAGSGPVGLTKQNASKYFIKYDAINNGVDGSLNNSSVSDDGTGVQTYNYTNNFTGADYASVAGMVSRSSGNDTGYLTAFNAGSSNDMTADTYSASQISFRTKNTNGTAMIDMDPVALINVGDLA